MKLTVKKNVYSFNLRNKKILRPIIEERSNAKYLQRFHKYERHSRLLFHHLTSGHFPGVCTLKTKLDGGQTVSRVGAQGASRVLQLAKFSSRHRAFTTHTGRLIRTFKVPRIGSRSRARRRL